MFILPKNDKIFMDSYILEITVYADHVKTILLSWFQHLAITTSPRTFGLLRGEYCLVYKESAIFSGHGNI